MKTVGLIAKIAMIIIMALSILFIVGSAMEADPNAEGSMTGSVITWTLGVFVLGIAGAVVSGIVGAISDTSNLLKSIIVVIGALAVVAVCWSLADGTPLDLKGYEGSENCSPWLQIADTGIFLFYVSAGVAVLAIICSEIYQLFR